VAVPTLSIASANAVLISYVWYVSRSKVSLPFLSDWEVLVGGVTQTFVLGGRGIEPINIICCQFWFLFHHGFHSMGLLLGLTQVVRDFKTSLFLMFDVVDKRDNVLDAADNNDGDDANKKSIYN
jgi:hypothetical protein